MTLAKVQSLWRYPVKSLGGECLTQLDINPRGVLGDRLFAISNKDGKFGSTKNTKRFRRIDGLLNLSAKTLNEGIEITFEDQCCLLDSDTQINNKLSQCLNQTVTLTKEKNIAHFDDGSIHILTTGSLTQLQNLLPNAIIDLKRFRANIIIDTQDLAHTFLGKTIRINDTVLEITHQTQRCALVSMEQQELKKQPNILKTIAQKYDMQFGVYAKVIKTGTINKHDTVEYL